MKLTIIFALLLAYPLFSSQHEREYMFCHSEIKSDPENTNFTFNEKQECLITTSNSWCAEHCPSAEFSGLDINLLPLIPSISGQYCSCGKDAIYFGYIDPRFKRYFAHVIRQIKYSNAHKECSCYWPELSHAAADISNQAYELFGILFESTALASLVENDEIMEEFRNTAFSACNFNTQIIFCIARQFRFSHYYRLANDLEDLAKKHFNEEESLEITENLQTILKELALLYSPLYQTCLEQHPNQEIEQEAEFIKLFLPDPEDQEEWDEEFQDFYDKPPTADHIFRFQLTEKQQRLAALNVSSLFQYRLEDTSTYEGKDSACFKILKNLIYELYHDQRFYQELKHEIPNLEDQFIEKLMLEAKKRKKEGIDRVQDLGTIDLESEKLSYLRYKIFRGNNSRYWNLKEKTSATNYYSLLEFITTAYKSDYVASIWLAPDHLLMAIFEDEDVVRDVVKTRQEIFETMEQGDDRLVVQDTLRKRFSDKLSGIDPKFIDFRINRKRTVSKLLTQSPK